MVKQLNSGHGGKRLGESVWVEPVLGAGLGEAMGNNVSRCCGDEFVQGQRMLPVKNYIVQQKALTPTQSTERHGSETYAHPDEEATHIALSAVPPWLLISACRRCVLGGVSVMTLCCFVFLILLVAGFFATPFSTMPFLILLVVL